MEEGLREDTARINALVIEYLEWTGLDEVCRLLKSECHSRGLPVSEHVENCKGNTLSQRTSPDFAGELLNLYDTGQGAKFFQGWRDVRESSGVSPPIELLTLEFYLHVYFATLPLRHGHKQDHLSAMAVFRRFLESCPTRVGTVQELLAFYALPYVPDPTQHPAFRQVFQDAWVRELRGRLCGWLGSTGTAASSSSSSSPSRPVLFSYLHQHRHHANSVGAAMMARESAASAVRSQRTLRRRLQKLQDDFHKLIGVSWELTQALEKAVRGERVDLEATLSACTHRYPELFTLTLTADTKAGPATILLESMQRCGQRRGPGSARVPALDFERVRADLGAAPETHVLLLLQALRHRITRVTTGSVRQAVVTAYVRGDVLGVRGSCRSWTRIMAALTNSHHHLLAQTAARLINALTAFTAGRSYLTSEDVCQMLLGSLRVEQPDPATTDMALAALQKLSIRGEVQEALIRGGAVEWLVDTLADARTLPPYTQEYATALLMNLTLRSEGRERCLPLAPTLLPALTQLLATVPVHVVPYVTGALYSLLSHPTLRQDAFDLGLDTTLQRLAQGGSHEQRRQLEYIVEQIQREPPLSPPPSPDPMLDLEEDPEWLEEELDLDDPVRPPPHAPAGEDLLAWRYTMHPSDPPPPPPPGERPREGAPVRSAPVVPWDPRPQVSHQTRPNSDGFVMRYHGQQQTENEQRDPGQEVRYAGNHWDYPSDSDTGRSNPHTSRSNGAEGGYVNGGAWSETINDGSAAGESWGQGSSGEGTQIREDWALTIRPQGEILRRTYRMVSPPPPTPPHQDPSRSESLDKTKGSLLDSPSRGRSAMIVSQTETSIYHGQQPPYHDLGPLETSSRLRSMCAIDERILEEEYEPDTKTKEVNLVEVRGSEDIQESPRGGGEGELKLQFADGQENIIIRGNYTRETMPANEDMEVLQSRQDMSQTTSEYDGSDGHRAIDYQNPDSERSCVDAEVETPSLAVPAAAAAAIEKEKEEEAEDGAVESEDRKLLPRRESVTPPRVKASSDPDPDPTQMCDAVASKLIEQLVGQSREMTAASSTPDSDPLLQSLPPPKASEYRVAFSSRPRLMRTPPGSAVDGGRQTRSSHQSQGMTGSPRSVLPPISRTNHTYTRTAERV